MAGSVGHLSLFHAPRSVGIYRVQTDLDPGSAFLFTGKIIFGRSHIRDVALKRLQPINDYLKVCVRVCVCVCVQ